MPSPHPAFIRRKPIRTLYIDQGQCPGDIIMLTAAVRDIKAAFPEIRINVETTCQELWFNNPHIDPTIRRDEADAWIYAEYPDIHRSNDGAYHFGHAFRHYLADMLGIRVPQGAIRGEVFVSPTEAERFGARLRAEGLPESGFWLVDAGIKSDYTAKGWELERWQKVVDLTSDAVTWIQIGAAEHRHPALARVIDWRGRTTTRDLVLLMHRAGGVITPVSFPMHLAAATPMFGQSPKRRRPCIVLAGGREPPSWVSYNEQRYVHTCGALPCCDGGGCWKSRVTPLGDGDAKDSSLCSHLVSSRLTGRPLQKCMDMITPERIAALVREYLEWKRA